MIGTSKYKTEVDFEAGAPNMAQSDMRCPLKIVFSLLIETFDFKKPEVSLMFDISFFAMIK